MNTITAQELKEFQNEMFKPYATSITNGGSFYLGVNAYGQFVVKSKREVLLVTRDADKAINMYNTTVQNAKEYIKEAQQRQSMLTV